MRIGVTDISLAHGTAKSPGRVTRRTCFQSCERRLVVRSEQPQLHGVAVSGALECEEFLRLQW